jgi:hypothetical protein
MRKNSADKLTDAGDTTGQPFHGDNRRRDFFSRMLYSSDQLWHNKFDHMSIQFEQADLRVKILICKIQ